MLWVGRPVISSLDAPLMASSMAGLDPPCIPDRVGLYFPGVGELGSEGLIVRHQYARFLNTPSSVGKVRGMGGGGVCEILRAT